eukprot:3982705-Pleurochrysis_carterae.AAC.1
MLNCDGKPRTRDQQLSQNFSLEHCFLRTAHLNTAVPYSTLQLAEHLQKYVNDQKLEEKKLPMRRLDPELVAAITANANPALGGECDFSHPSAGDGASDEERDEPKPGENNGNLSPDPPIPQNENPLLPMLPADDEPFVPEPSVWRKMQYVVGQRIQCNFQPFTASWYGGVVGMVEESCIYVGFDDGELRAFFRKNSSAWAKLACLRYWTLRVV